MIRDFAQLSGPNEFNADICIIGAGPAGLTIAREFACTSKEVILLESGGFDVESSTQDLYNSEIVGLPHIGIHEGRIRIFGGTATLWGGQTVRFDEFELKPRTWVPYSGWPISYTELTRYYERADQLLQLGPCVPYQELCTSFGIDPPPFDTTKLYVDCSRWSPKPNLGKEWRSELIRAPNLLTLLHSNVTSIITNASANQVEKIEFKTLAGKTGLVRARYFVICCGGIETARLLLASATVQANGVGNDHGLVGRFFQEHIHYTLGSLVTDKRARLQDCFESFYKKSLKYFPILAISKRAQENHEVLNIHGVVGFDSETMFALKQLYRYAVLQTGRPHKDFSRLLGNGLTGYRDLLRVAYRFYIKKRAGTAARGTIGMGAQVECAPNPDSRILLSESRDILGMRKVKLDWKVTELEKKTIVHFIQIIADEFERLELGSFVLNHQGILQKENGWLAEVHDSAHHMGTTRMSDTPERGVVNSQCQVHGIHNLYIGSSAVFPTSGRANPTLTIMALCLRIADRLKGFLN